MSFMTHLLLPLLVPDSGDMGLKPEVLSVGGQWDKTATREDARLSR